MMLSAKEHAKKYVEVLGQRMAYVEMGSGDPIVFQHGNPTSSYLWRNVMPHARRSWGAASRPTSSAWATRTSSTPSGPDRYTLRRAPALLRRAARSARRDAQRHARLHDWGSALGFDWARRHRDAVKGICLHGSDRLPDARGPNGRRGATQVFQGFRSAAGEDMVLAKNVFVERVLPGSILRKLTDEEMAVYRRPFAEPGEGRRPTLTWPRQIPLDGEPADVVAFVQNYADWLAQERRCRSCSSTPTPAQS